MIFMGGKKNVEGERSKDIKIVYKKTNRVKRNWVFLYNLIHCLTVQIKLTAMYKIGHELV